MLDPRRLELVHKAIESAAKCGGCCEWNTRSLARIKRFGVNGLAPNDIRRLLIEFVLDGNTLTQRRETRPEYGHRDDWFMAVIPHPQFDEGLFIELDLINDDSDLPEVSIVNAHGQQS